ncbi:hypothetical protein TNCV_48101 [Trichonephila clavipes]|nr:hypothetical protein TNCV_48101 [Trichonephila clavipes]
MTPITKSLGKTWKTLTTVGRLPRLLPAFALLPGMTFWECSSTGCRRGQPSLWLCWDGWQPPTTVLFKLRATPS